MQTPPLMIMNRRQSTPAPLLAPKQKYSHDSLLSHATPLLADPTRVTLSCMMMMAMGGITGVFISVC